MTAVIVVALVLLGLCLGSFVNAMVWRLHILLEAAYAKRPRKPAAKYSLAKGRSMCPHCEHALAARDLVPLASWLWLRGKCRYCRKPISWQYPLVEAATAGLFVASFIWWPQPLQGDQQIVLFVFWLIFLVGFMALAVYDIRWFMLPDRIGFPLIGLALVQTGLKIWLWHGGGAALASAAWGVAIASGIFYVIYRVAEEMDRQWIGFGDVKLGIILGLILGGPWLGVLLLFFSSLLGSVISLPFMRAGRSRQIPYGPFLLAATVILQLSGPWWLDALNRWLLIS